MSKKKWCVVNDTECTRLDITGPSLLNATTMGNRFVCVWMRYAKWNVSPKDSKKSISLSHDTSLSPFMESELRTFSLLPPIILMGSVSTSSFLSKGQNGQVTPNKSMHVQVLKFESLTFENHFIFLWFFEVFEIWYFFSELVVGFLNSEKMNAIICT